MKKILTFIATLVAASTNVYAAKKDVKKTDREVWVDTISL